jgi:hypothetical protein
MPPLSVMEKSESGLEKEILNGDNLDKGYVSLSILPVNHRDACLQEILDDIGYQFDRGGEHMISVEDMGEKTDYDVPILTGKNGWSVICHTYGLADGCKSYTIHRPTIESEPSYTDIIIGQDLKFNHKTLARYLLGVIEHKKGTDFHLFWTVLSHVGDGKVRELRTLRLYVNRMSKPLVNKKVLYLLQYVEEMLFKKYGKTTHDFVYGEANRHKGFNGGQGKQFGCSRDVVLDYLDRHGNGFKEDLKRSDIVNVLR